MTLETVHQILAGSSVITGVRSAFINIDGAGGAAPPWCTLTLVALAGFCAAPSVRARIGQTGVLRSLTVGSRIAFSTGALILVRSCVDTRPSIQTWLVSATEIQIFVAKMSTPVGVTQALPGLHTGAMYTARVGDTLVTVLALPAIKTLAATWLFARSMFGAAALSAYSCVALRPGPSFQARLVAIVVAGVMSKELVSGPAELVAAETVVVLITADPDLVIKLGYGAVVGQLLPMGAGVDHAGMRGFLYHLPICTYGFIVEVQGFHYQSVGPRPGKTEGQNYPGSLIPDSALQRKRIPSKDRRRSRSEAAGPCSRDSRLVFLQANFKKGIALIPCAFSIRRVPRAITTQAVQQLSVHIMHR